MISIVIPCKKAEEAKKCVEYCHRLDRKDIEILVLPDDLTGKVSPAAKRNIGIKMSKGERCAFIDSDAYPDRYWLNYTVKDAAGWCGPGLLPPDSSPKEKAADWILRLLPFSYRVKKGKLQYVNDYPTFNLIFHKWVLEKVGGFNESTLTGEDSDICQRITNLGMKIIYIPQCVVYHYRRPLIIPFLRQISIYATHRGHFFKKGVGNSRKLVYALPSICLLSLISWLVYLLLF